MQYISDSSGLEVRAYEQYEVSLLGAERWVEIRIEPGSMSIQYSHPEDYVKILI